MTPPPPPHIFSVADAAFNQLDLGVTSQVLIVNGESGAGKTEACRQLMRYIAAASSETRRRSTASEAEAAVLETASLADEAITTPQAAAPA